MRGVGGPAGNRVLDWSRKVNSESLIRKRCRLFQKRSVRLLAKTRGPGLCLKSVAG